MSSPHSKTKNKFVLTPIVDSKGSWIMKCKHAYDIGPIIEGNKTPMHTAGTCSPDDRKIMKEKEEIGPIVAGEHISMYTAVPCGLDGKKRKKEKEKR